MVNVRPDVKKCFVVGADENCSVSNSDLWAILFLKYRRQLHFSVHHSAVSAVKVIRRLDEFCSIEYLVNCCRNIRLVRSLFFITNHLFGIVLSFRLWKQLDSLYQLGAKPGFRFGGGVSCRAFWVEIIPFSCLFYPNRKYMLNWNLLAIVPAFWEL